VSSTQQRKRLPLSAKTKDWSRQTLLPPIAAFCAIYLITLTTAYLNPIPQSPILACSMGASAVIVFVTPSSRFATPWSLIGGHFFSALVGISCAIGIPGQCW
jgi:CBS domain-containing membrane protein